MEKACERCKKVKDESDFYRTPKSDDGLTKLCINCITKYYEDNPEEKAKRDLNWKIKSGQLVKKKERIEAVGELLKRREDERSADEEHERDIQRFLKGGV